MRQVLGRMPRDPHSRELILGAQAPVQTRRQGDEKANRCNKSDRTKRGTAHERAATRHPRETRGRRQPWHNTRCQQTTANVENMHHTQSTGRSRGVRKHAGCTEVPQRTQ